MNFAPCVAFTLAQEGGLVDDPNDPGGLTNRGITVDDVSEFFNQRIMPNIERAIVQNLTQAQAEAIYLARYWLPLDGDALPAGVDLCVFDHGVNRGIETSALLLQSLLGVRTDGWIGPKTIQAVTATDARALIGRLVTAQRAQYQALRSFPVFGKGWLARVDAREAAALAMLG